MDIFKMSKNENLKKVLKIYSKNPFVTIMLLNVKNYKINCDTKKYIFL
jgi:hypothetical protein